MTFYFIAWLISFSANATQPNSVPLCRKLFPIFLRELEHRGSDPKGKLIAPFNARLAFATSDLGYHPPSGRPFDETSDLPQFQHIDHEELKAARAAIAIRGGSTWIWEEASAAFGVSPDGRPYFQWHPQMNEALLDHELAHFHHWEELFIHYAKTLPRKNASLKAYDAMNTPEGSLIAESRAVAKELRRLKLWDAIPEDPKELVGLVNYPYFNAVDIALTLISKLQGHDLRNISGRRLMTIRLKRSLDRYADKVIRQTKRFENRALSFPRDFMSPADIGFFRTSGNWAAIRSLFERRIRLQAPSRAADGADRPLEKESGLAPSRPAS